MKQVKVVNQSRGLALAKEAGLADNTWTRLRGLLGRPPLQPGQGLVIKPSTGIHTWFMGYPMDAVYVAKDGEVVACVEDMPPFRFGPVMRRCHLVVELPAGTIRHTGTAVGDHLALE